MSCRWSSSSWFAGGGGLQEAAAAAQPAVAPAAAPVGAETAQHQEGTGIIAVGGARAQSRFSGKTAIPIATCAPLSSAGRAAAAAPAPARIAAAGGQLAPPPAREHSSIQGQLAAAPLPASTRHAAWAGQPVGHTVDGSVPDRSGSACGEHVSRWVFDTASWQWRVRDGHPCGPAGGPSDKHQLAARRWGDSRDALGAAVLGRQQAEAQQQEQRQASSSEASMAAAASSRPGAAPAKRQRLHVGAMTGDTSDAGWAAVGGLQRQKDALMEAVAYPLAHPRLFARLGAGGARGVLLHGPPGEWLGWCGLKCSACMCCTKGACCDAAGSPGRPPDPPRLLYCPPPLQAAARRTWCAPWRRRRGWASWCSTAASAWGRRRRSG